MSCSQYDLLVPWISSPAVHHHRCVEVSAANLVRYPSDSALRQSEWDTVFRAGLRFEFDIGDDWWLDRVVIQQCIALLVWCCSLELPRRRYIAINE